MWPYQPRNSWGGFAYPNMPPRPYQEQMPYVPPEWTHSQRPNIVRPYYPIVQNQPSQILSHSQLPPHTQPPPPPQTLVPQSISHNNPYYTVQTATTIDTDLRFGQKPPPPPPPPEPQIVRSALFPSAINSSELPMHSSTFPIQNYPRQSAHNFLNAPPLPKKPLPAWLKAELERLDKTKKSDDNKIDAKKEDELRTTNGRGSEISGTKWTNENSSSDISDAEESENNFINEKSLIYSKQQNPMSERKGSFPFCQANNDLMDFQIAWSRLGYKERQTESAKIFTTTLTSVMLEVTSDMTREVIKDLIETLQANRGDENHYKPQREEEKPQAVTLVPSSLVAYDSEEESSDESVQVNPLQELLQLEKEPIVEDENIPLPKNYETPNKQIRKNKIDEKERHRRSEKHRSRDRSKHRSKKRSSSFDSNSSSSSNESSNSPSSSSTERSKSKKRPKSYSSSKSKKLSGSETSRSSKKRSSDKTSSSSSRRHDRHHRKRQK